MMLNLTLVQSCVVCQKVLLKTPCSHHIHVNLFVDDMVLAIKHKNIEIFQQLADQELCIIHEWMKTN